MGLNISETDGGDELVSLTRIVEELAWPTYRVRLAMRQIGARLQVVRSGRLKRYPLAHTVALLREQHGRLEERPDVKEDELVTFETLVAELGWSPNTVRKYLSNVTALLRPLADERDARKKAYPRHHTVRLLRREHARVRARRERAQDDAAGYWTALSTLKVAAGRLRRLASESAGIEREMRQAFEALRRRPPGLLAEFYSLPDTNLELIDPMCALVAPLRLIYWKATVPEIPLRGEGRTPEEAVLDLRQKLAYTFRELQLDPESNPQLWALLRMLVQEKEEDRAAPKAQSAVAD